MRFHFVIFLAFIFLAQGRAAVPKQDPFQDSGADLNAKPVVAEGFEISLWAKEPLVRNPCSIAFEGHGRMFIGYGMGHVRILSKADGKLVGTLRQNVNGWKGSDGQVDAAYGMTVTLRKTGEYVVVFENAAWANIMMTRWCPSGVCTATPSEAASKSN